MGMLRCIRPTMASGDAREAGYEPLRTVAAGPFRPGRDRVGLVPGLVLAALAIASSTAASSASDAIAVQDVRAGEAVLRQVAKDEDRQELLDLFLAQATNRLKEMVSEGGLTLVVRGADAGSWIVEQGAMGKLELDLGRSAYVVACEIDSFDVVNPPPRTVRNPALPQETEEWTRTFDVVGSVTVMRSDQPDVVTMAKVGGAGEAKVEAKRDPHGIVEEELPDNPFGTLTSSVATMFAEAAADVVLEELAPPLVLSCSAGAGFLIDPRSKRLEPGEVWSVIREGRTPEGTVIPEPINRLKIEQVHGTYAIAKPVRPEPDGDDTFQPIQAGDTLVRFDGDGVATGIFNCPPVRGEAQACWQPDGKPNKPIPLLVFASPWDDEESQRFASRVRGAIAKEPGIAEKVRLIDPDAILFSIESLGKMPKQGDAEEGLIGGVAPQVLCRLLDGAAYVFVEKPVTSTSTDEIALNDRRVPLPRADSNASWRLFEATDGVQLAAGEDSDFERFRIDPGSEVTIDRVEERLAGKIGRQIVERACQEQARIKIPPILRKVAVTVSPEVALPDRKGDMGTHDVQANLFIDGVLVVGQTPRDYKITVGIRRLRFEGPGLEPYEIFQRIDDPDGKKNVIEPLLPLAMAMKEWVANLPVAPGGGDGRDGGGAVVRDQLPPESKRPVIVKDGVARVWDPFAGLN